MALMGDSLRLRCFVGTECSDLDGHCLDRNQAEVRTDRRILARWRGAGWLRSVIWSQGCHPPIAECRRVTCRVGSARAHAGDPVVGWAGEWMALISEPSRCRDEQVPCCLRRPGTLQ